MIRKKVQEQKFKILASVPKKAQEEMVGFAVIIAIVAVIMLFLLVIYLRSSGAEEQESYEAGSFVQSVLQYTTECEDYFGGLSVQKLVFVCASNARCLNTERNSCEILDSTLKEILDESWNIGENSPIKGYEMKIISEEEEIFSAEKGEKTSNYKGSVQDFAEGRSLIKIIFRAYFKS